MAQVQKYGLLAVKAVLSAFFLYAAFGKFTGNPMVVGVFDAIGWGQWFRYLAGAMQAAGAVLIWVPGLQAIGAVLIGATMLGAAIAHIVLLGVATMVPSLVMGLLAALVLFAHRDQIARRIGTQAA